MIGDGSAHVLAIDLGVDGAFAVVTGFGELAVVGDLPVVSGRISAPLLAEIVVEYGFAEAIVVEKVHAMPTGSRANFSMGSHLGTVLGVAGALERPVHELAPTKWKRAVGLTGRYGTATERKEAGRELALRLWPEHAERFGRKKDHNRADAALLGRAHFALTSAGVPS